MSNALQTLRFEDTEVTALDCNTDEPVSVASPIAKKLAYESAKDMLRNLDSDEKGKHIVPTLGGEQEMSVITLPGLIHALNNRRPGAVKDEATRKPVGREIPAGSEAYRPSAGVGSTRGHRLPEQQVRHHPQGAGPWRIRVSRIRNREKR